MLASHIELTALAPGGIRSLWVHCEGLESGIALETVVALDNDHGSIPPIAEHVEPDTVLEFGWDDLTTGVPTPDTGATTEPVMRWTLNEQHDNPDGSRTVHGLHIQFLAPELGSGDIIIGSATCGPPGLPVPLAAGAGLWLSLGLLGLLGLAIIPAAVVLRRRQALTAPA